MLITALLKVKRCVQMFFHSGVNVLQKLTLRGVLVSKRLGASVESTPRSVKGLQVYSSVFR